MAWDVSTWAAGATVTAAQLNARIRDNFKAIGDPWTSYTPTIANLTTSGVTAKYVVAGKLTIVRFTFTLTAAPTGAVTLTMPFAASTAFGTGAQANIGSITGNRAGTYHHGSVFQSSSTVVGFISSGGTAAWTAATPAAWANTDVWSGTFTYEAA